MYTAVSSQAIVPRRGNPDVEQERSPVEPPTGSRSTASSASSRAASAPSTESTSRSRPGEIYGFLGPNGAGKSTTVHMLTTLLPPTAGSARVAGFDVVKQGADVRDAIGAALQEAALDPNLTARDHMRLQGALHGMSKADRTRRGDELIERVGLADAADRKVGGYSGGMKRRLDLALALLHGPRVLFLDEPTTGLDIQSRSRALGRGRPPLPRRGHDGLPHHPVPRGGRPARRPPRDHRPRQDRRRGHPRGAQGRGRPPDGRGRPDRPRRARPRRRAAPTASASSFPGRPRAPRCGSNRTAARSSPTSSAPSTRQESRSRTSSSTRPSLNDVFLTKTGRSLEGAQREAEEGETGEQPALEGAAA